MRVLGTLFTLPNQLFDDAILEDSTTFAERSEAIGQEPITYSERTTRENFPESLPEPVCLTCTVSASLRFTTLEEQRAHFKSDWHRFNLKRKLKGRPPLDESSVEAFIEEEAEISSISGSESSSEDEEDGTGRQTTGPQMVFQAKDTRFAIWRVLLGPNTKEASAAVIGQQLRSLREDSGFWAVILSRGGHFAAAIFACGHLQVLPKQAPKGVTAPLFQVVAHKTLHRYVVRAKAGGKQSGKDASGKFAKSAGSQIRRYNEGALRLDILETLQSWRPHLEKVSHIFIAAPGGNEATLFEAGASPLDRSDPRVHRVPFTTKRPTFSETKRVLTTLLTVVEPQAAQSAPPPKVSPSQSRQLNPTKPAEKQGAAATETPAGDVPEPELHQASRQGDASLVASLLREGHNPTVSVGKTAYAVAASKEVRDAFRRHMASAPQQWDWTAAGVPSALTAGMEEQQQAKEAQKKAKLKEREKERKKRAAERKKSQQASAAAAAEAEISAAIAEAAALAPRGNDVEGKKVQRSQQEMQKKREQMAAAAEARMAALKLASQEQKLW